MAIQTSIIQFSGRVGNLVGRKLPDGQFSISAYQPKVHNPRTSSQTFNRAKMSVATRLASRLGWVMHEAKHFSGFGSYAHNRLLGRIKHALSGNCVGIFPAALPLIPHPDIEARFSSLSISRQGTLVTLHAELVSNQAETLLRSVAAVIVYNQTRNLWLSVSLRHEGLPDTRLQIPDQWQDDDLQLAGYLLFAFRNDPPAKPTPDTPTPAPQLSISQIACVYSMPEHPVPIPSIYKKHKHPKGKKSSASATPAKTHTKSSPNSDTTTSYLCPNSDIPPSLRNTTSPPS